MHLASRHALRSHPSVVAMSVVTSLVVVYVATLLYTVGGPAEWLRTGLSPSPDLHFALLRLGGKSNPLIDQGELWRLLTAVFLHAGLLHLLVNVAGVYFLGRLSSAAFGRRRTTVLFLLSGVGGSVASYLFSDALSVGASGALFGLIGGLAVFLLRIRERIRPGLRRVILFGLPVWVLLNVLVGLFWPDVDNAAHIGGFVSGALIGAFYPRERTRTPGLVLHTLFVVSCTACVFCASMAAHSASGALPVAEPPLAPLRAHASLPAPVVGPTASNVVPSDWRIGRFRERHCDLALEGRPVDGDPPWCFVDPYESVLVLGSVEEMFDYDQEVVAAFQRFSGPTMPFEKSTANDRLFILPLGRGYAYVMACHPLAADRYRPLMRRLFLHAAPARPPAPTRPLPAETGAPG